MSETFLDATPSPSGASTHNHCTKDDAVLIHLILFLRMEIPVSSERLINRLNRCKNHVVRHGPIPIKRKKWLARVHSGSGSVPHSW